jgi:hypothetical protein
MLVPRVGWQGQKEIFEMMTCNEHGPYQLTHDCQEMPPNRTLQEKYFLCPTEPAPSEVP